MPPEIQLNNVPKTGTFVVAVSGGLDSTVLLYLLKNQRPQFHVVVAHLEHGIRTRDSLADARFVEALAQRFGYKFEMMSLQLGPHASEEIARNSRYAFLQQICNKHHAVGIMTAHHQDDVIETMCINIHRGTAWRGLCSLRSTPHISRPLLSYSKKDLKEYANKNGITWRHDSTNDSDHYLRNRIRHHLVPLMSPSDRQKLIHLWHEQCELRQQIEKETEEIYKAAVFFELPEWTELSRYYLSMVSRPVALEVLRHAALRIGGKSLLHNQLEHLLTFVLTGRPGSHFNPGGGLNCRSTKRGIVVGKD